MSDLATDPMRLPRSLKAGSDHLSKRDRCSVNQFVAMVAAKKLAALDAEDYFHSSVAWRAYLLACRVKQCLK